MTGQQRLFSGSRGEICLAWVCDDSRLCSLPRHHKGTHLASPIPWPRQDISATNPSSPKGRVA